VNDGKISPKELQRVLKKVTNNKYSDEELIKFIRQLKKDDSFKINYQEFIERIILIGNKQHNPFKTLMHRFAFFLDQNKISVKDLMKRLTKDTDSNLIPLAHFTDFLKQKIEKRRQFHDLFCQCQLIDIDKDGFISEDDLLTCLRNLNSTMFYKNSGNALTTSTFSNSNKFFTGIQDQKMNTKKIL
jgi:Ca2+-binding EF-hand superfamily protein